MIAASQLLPHQKTRLHDYFMSREIISGLRARQERQAAKAASAKTQASGDHITPD